MIYNIAALFCGLVGKMYDDLSDNKRLSKFKSEYLMELLKGFHYVAFVPLSLIEPIFLIIFYLADILNHIGNKHAFSKPYEKSLFLSFGLLFLFTDYKKLQQLPFLDYIICIFFFLGMLIEPIIVNEDVSILKLCMRIYFLFCYIFISFFICSKSIMYTLLYCMGYFFVSICVQYYSLFIHKAGKKGYKYKKMSIIKIIWYITKKFIKRCKKIITTSLFLS